MTFRRRTTAPAQPEADAPAAPMPPALPARRDPGVAHGPIGQRVVASRSPEEAEERYVVARDAWTAAMRAASSGRPADLAALALAQEAYETARADRERWENGARVAIPVDPAIERSAIEVAVGQELAWRKVHRTDGAEERPKGLIGRLFGKGR